MEDYTLDYIVSASEWTLIAENCKNVGIQFNSQGDIRVHVTKTNPLAVLNMPGILLSSYTEGVPGTFGLGQLPSDAKVYVRATGSVEEVKLTVLAY